MKLSFTLFIIIAFSEYSVTEITDDYGEDVPDFYVIDFKNDVKFFAYTRNNPDVSVQLYMDDVNIAPINPLKSVKIIIHGFHGDVIGDEWIFNMKNLYLETQDINVILVDWSNLSHGLMYNIVKSRVQSIGQYVGQFLDNLSSNGGQSSLYHCIGHSLGAHICGVAGKNISDNNLGRISALDAALPLFAKNNTEETLSPGDANYVDAIHTCGGRLGFYEPIGHADFYPNDGTASQPGCGIDLTGSCSHGRAHEYFAESIKTKGFISKFCDTWEEFESGLCKDNHTISIMGEFSDISSRGIFYLYTSDAPPYSVQKLYL